MKLIALLMLFFFVFSLSGCKKSNETKYKIQKYSTFQPVCEKSKSARCCIKNTHIKCETEGTGNPVCGTKPGEGKIKAYCIGINDDIIREIEEVRCGEKKYSGGEPVCQETVERRVAKVQKNSNFQPTCADSESKFVKCTEGWPVCGTIPGSTTMNVYCIDMDSDNVLFSEHSIIKGICEDGKYPTCEPVQSDTL